MPFSSGFPTVYYRARDGKRVCLLRDDEYSHRMYVRVSADGTAWPAAKPTDIPDSPSLSSAVVLADGTVLLIGNQMAPRFDNPGETRHYGRDPLMVSVSAGSTRHPSCVKYNLFFPACRLYIHVMNLKPAGHLPVILAVLVLAPFQNLGAAETSNVLAQIERMVSLGEKAERGLGEQILKGIEANPSAVSKELAAKLADPGLTETRQAVYAWALGLAKDPAHVRTLIALHDKTPSALVKSNCQRALSQIGGTEAAACLLAGLDAAKDEDDRFDLLNLLARMQAEEALAKTEEILRKDPDEYYWQSIFVFGKMGDKAVPFLLKKIVDPDRNVRANAIHLLGQWLIAPESARPLQERYPAEPDEELRVAILSSLERVMPTLEEMKPFFEKAAKPEGKGKAETFARETLANIPAMKKGEALFSQRKKPAEASFRAEYDKLFHSAGKEGDYALLAASSNLADEPALKILRERILQRDSDECFHDYQKVNEIIMQNRRIGMNRK